MQSSTGSRLSPPRSVRFIGRGCTRRPVAVKIQYPGGASAIDADLANLELLSTFIGLLMSFSPRRIGVDVRAVAREVAERIRSELDYREEATNQRAFADFYRGHPFIRVPEVVDELSADRVLTQDLVEGLTWEQAQRADRELRERWAQTVLHFGQGSVHTFEIVNVDPHPGHYRFHLYGTVSFLDFGCVIRVRSTLPDSLRDCCRRARAATCRGPGRRRSMPGFGRHRTPSRRRKHSRTGTSRW